jgi:1-acyl-sn-glycerol-3-phosphate acyltransferase
MTRFLYYIPMYFVSLLVFGAVGLGLNAVCGLLLVLPGREARAPAVREAIRRLFGKWVAWLNLMGLVRVHWHGPDVSTCPRPAVYVANHPSLIDATLLLARLPNTICIFKPALRRNPCLAPAAIMAGYASGDAGIDLIHQVAAELKAGQNLLVFPEGTRTSLGATCNPLKPGFALMARRAGVPIQVLAIRVDREVLPRGRPWWRAPQLPARFDIHVDRALPSTWEHSASEVVAAVEGRLAEWLPGPA